ncbi:hypothetical protein RRG08_011057 [Elysia crispata]|uniref:Uncharacterized protein n=1 Tax=Elysia crispata TaxID=231223 RepID=A0AAE1DCJ3_9GAST|nr:hypothetical protein RRG08_011057 [Elysia crispata]
MFSESFVYLFRPKHDLAKSRIQSGQTRQTLVTFRDKHADHSFTPASARKLFLLLIYLLTLPSTTASFNPVCAGRIFPEGNKDAWMIKILPGDLPHLLVQVAGKSQDNLNLNSNEGYVSPFEQEFSTPGLRIFNPI